MEKTFWIIHLSLSSMWHAMLTTMPETSDGSDTFHGMGISQFVTPGTKKYQPNSQNESYTELLWEEFQSTITRKKEWAWLLWSSIKWHNFKAEEPSAYLDIFGKISTSRYRNGKDVAYLIEWTAEDLTVFLSMWKVMNFLIKNIFYSIFFPSILV